MEVSVVLVNYRVQRYLHLALQSLEQSIAYFDRKLAGETEELQGWLPSDLRLPPLGSEHVEVWVVDNNSEDGSEALIKANFPWVHWIQNAENVGFAKANNIALRKSKGRHLLLQNPDTVLTEVTLWNCWQAMESDSKLGALGVRMLDGRGHFLRESKRGLPTPLTAFFKLTGLAVLFPRHPRIAAYHLGHLHPKKDHDVAILAGAFMWVRAKVAQEIGLLDERYFMYGEDIDWSYRILRAGYRNRYLGSNPIIHFKGESTQKESMHYVRMFYGAMMEFAGRYYGSSKSFWLHLMLRIGIMGRAMVSVLRRWSVWVFLPVVDWLGFVWTMNIVTHFWENTVKVDPGLAYPDEFKSYVIPAYVSVWVFSSWLNGAYDTPYRYRRIIRGMVMGTLAIGFVYAFLPSEWRFSRGLILAGTAACLFFSFSFKWLIRILLNYPERGYLHRRANMAIGIGRDATMEVVSQWYVTEWGTRWLGYVHSSVSPTDPMRESLGHAKDLKSLVHTLGADEIVVDTEVVNFSNILHFMEDLTDQSPYVKFLPRGLSALIGGGEVIVGESNSGQGLIESWPIGFQKDQRIRNILFGVFLFGLQSVASFRLRPVYRDGALPRRLWSDQMDWLGYSKYPTKPFLLDLELVLSSRGLKTDKAQRIELHRMVIGRDRRKAWAYSIAAIAGLWQSPSEPINKKP